MHQIGEDRIELVQKLYVSNVKGRLRELETPDDDLQKRWIWELIQNAKDCSKEAKTDIPYSDQIPFELNSKGVDIKIIYDESKKLVIFKHNGFPFVGKTLDSLMYKNTTKDNDENTTGRFGTGFMTSHTLSRIVPIHAPFLSRQNNTWKLSYIEAIVYREGSTDKQLRQEFVKMEKSKKSFEFDPDNEEHKWTTFTYQLTNKLGFNSAKLGIESFRENIMKVLLFCDDINSIQLNDEDPIFSSAVSNNTLSKSLIEQNVFKHLQIIEKTVTYSTERKFIVASVKHPDQEYSLKFAKYHDREYKEKNIEFSIAFEIDSDKNLIDLEPNQVCLFCTFPLIGSSSYQLPFFIDSPIFETLTERNGIILEGERLDSNDILSNTGLNFLILNSSIKLFQIILHWLIENEFTNFACFSNGLKFNSKTVESMKPFLNDLREVLEKSPLVHNSSNAITQLNQIVILDFNNVKNKKTFHHLASKFYSNVASYKECKQWQNKTWEKISVLDFATFIKHINCIESKNYQNDNHFQFSKDLFTNGLSSLNDNDFDFLNEFYSFILAEESTYSDKINENSIFFRSKIVLNSNCKFTFLSNLKSDTECSQDFNEIMKLCTSWSDKIIHPRIISFKLFVPKITINDATQEINNFLYDKQGDTQLLLSFIRFVDKDDEYRLKMYEVAHYFYKDTPPEVAVTNVDENLWKCADSYLLKQINQSMLNQKKIKNKITIEKSSLKYYNTFYELYQKNFTNNNFLVPNFKLVLTEKAKLKQISKSISQELLETLCPFINFESYAHPAITTVNFAKTYEFDDLMKTVNSDDFYSENGYFTDKPMFAVLSILPPQTNHRLFSFQNKIIELAQLFYCSEIKTKQTPIVNELFWKKVNEMVLNNVEDILRQHNDIQTLKESLNKDEKTIFDNLNMYYDILNSDYSCLQMKAFVPNYKGILKPANQICFSSGISETLFDLFNLTKPEKDIRDEFAHPNIICNFLKVVDLKQFIGTISANLSDEQLINNSKILQVISSLNIPDYQEDRNSTNVSNDNEILLQKLYVANIKNRLKEIQNPNENDKTRWPWELIQNAKDSLYSPLNDDQSSKVKIYIEINKDPKTNKYSEVIFSHDGPPFTDNSFIGLLYKISQEKDNPETTGRFGTGFVSTHVLSKIVEISGNKMSKNKKLVSFHATMHREGIKDDEIIQDFKEMQRRQEFSPKLLPLTTFKYKIRSDQSRKCVELGLNHLKSHISEVLINCPEIKKVVLIENGVRTKYTSSKSFKKFYSIYNINENNEIYQRFVVIKDKVKKINISVEINNEKMIVPIKNESDTVFVSFPLVGSKAHILPFYINSPKFEPSTERNALILDGDEEINGELTNTGINRSLLLESCVLFDKLIDALKDLEIANIYELSRGLTLPEKPYSSFDMKWYQDNFLKQLRETLANKLTVKKFNGQEILLKDSFIPSKEINSDILGQFIDLVKKYCANVVCEEDAILWKDRAWDSLNIIKIDGLMAEVECDPELLNEEQLPYLNNLLGFIWNYDKNILYEFFLIPDMNNYLHSLSKEEEGFDMKESKNVHDQIINLMESIEIPWKSTHMNNFIKSISLPEDDMIVAEGRIIAKIKEDNSKCFELMKYILETKNEFRRNMFEFACELEFINSNSEIVVSDINPSIWDFADHFVFQSIVEKISKFNSEKVSEMISFFCRFLPVFLNFDHEDDEFVKSAKIFPNANCNLQTLSSLHNKVECFHDYMNAILIEFCDHDINETILHPEVNKIIKAKSDESITHLIDLIIRKIKDYDDETKKKIAESLLCVVPLESEPKDDNIIKQRKFYSLYRAFINPDIKEVLIDSKYFSVHYWKTFNHILISNICQKIESTGTLASLMEAFSIEDEEHCFSFLNDLYSFTDDFVDKFRIIPNQSGIFKYKKDLKQNLGIKKDLLDCISILQPGLIAQYEFSDHRVKINDLKRIQIMEFYSKLNQMFNDALKDPNSDQNVIKMIKQISLIDEESLIDKLASKDMNEDQKARLQILQNAHVTFLKNRLRELDSNPTKKDYERWPFELIQNANDSLFCKKVKPEENQEEEDLNKRIKINFEFSEDKVIFSHNGSPFTIESFFALLYQCSENKEFNKKTIGRFGTGFMSTLILSKIIKLSGDIQKLNGKSGFSVTMYRNGSDTKELKEGIDKMEKSIERNLEPNNLTTFEYIFEKDSIHSKEACKEGLSALKKYISPILLFNPTIESITIKTAQETLTYCADHEEGPIYKITITNNKNRQYFERFILFSSNNQFDESKDIKIDCLLPIDDKANRVIFNYYPTVLFLSYPLIGLQDFRSPIIINSPNFEPEKERGKLILQKIKEKDEKDVEEESMPEDAIAESHESLINKFIISKSVDLFQQIMEFVIENNYTDLFNISHGLKDGSLNKFIQENFIVKMRNVILSSNVFETSSGYRTANEIVFPYIDDYKLFIDYDKNSRDFQIKRFKEFYKLVSHLSHESKQCITYLNCTNWLSLLWSDFPSKIGIDQFIQEVSKYERVSNIQLIADIEDENNNNSNEAEEQKEENEEENDQSNITKDKDLDINTKFIKNVITFVAKLNKCNDILNENALLINEHSIMVKREDIYKFDIPSVFFDMFRIVNIDYKKIALHNSIKSLYENDKIEFKVFNLESAIESIKNNINRNNSPSLMKYSIKNSQMRESMFDYTHFFLDKSIEKVYLQFPEILNFHTIRIKLDEMFKQADSHVIYAIIDKIQTFDIQSNIDFYFNFVSFLKTNISYETFVNSQIFPNQLYKACNSLELHEDLIRDNDTKTIIESFFGINLRQELIHERFADFIDLKQITFQTLSNRILRNFGDDAFANQINLRDITERFKLYSIIFEHSNIDEKLQDVINILSFFMHFDTEIPSHQGEESNFTAEFMKKIRKVAVHEVVDFISQFNCINMLQSNINNNDNSNDDYESSDFTNEIYNHLSILYKFTTSGKIFPNKNNEFILIDEINWLHDEQLEDDVMNQLLFFLNRFRKSDEINESILNESIVVSERLKKCIRVIDLKFLTENILSAIENSDDKESDQFKSLKIDFMRFIATLDGLRIAFASLIKNELNSNLTDFLDYLSQSNEILEVGYKGEALVYEALLKSGNYSEVIWLAKSEEPTQLRIKLENGNEYYINENGEHYDIYAEDDDNNKYYFEVKSTKADDKFNFTLSKYQMELAKEMNDPKDHFILALVSDVHKSPEILFLSKKNLF